MTAQEYFKAQHISQTAKMLRLFKEKRIVSNKELNAICFRYAARIHELRREGHIIITNHVKDSLYHFHYMGERKEKEYGDVS